MARSVTFRGRVRWVLHRLARAVAGRVLRRRHGHAQHPTPVTFLLGNAYGIGGTTRTCLNVAGHLARTHPVEIVSIVRERDEPMFAFPAGVVVTPLADRRGGRRGVLDRLPSILMLPLDHRMHRWASLRTDIDLLRVLWRVRSGVLIGTRPALNVLVARLGRPGLRTIGQEHINLDTHRPRIRAELLAAYARLDVVAALTEHDRAALEAALGDRARVVAIPNAVPALAGPPADLRRPVVVAIGRLSHQKGFDLLIDAFAQVAPAAPGWSLRIGGGGELRGELQRRIDDHGLGDRVRLLGPVRNVGAELGRASIYALSSRFEGLPLALLEAMSKGLAIVAFDCPTGPAEVLEGGRSGVLVAPGDVDALAAAILELVNDERRRGELGEAARRRVADYSIEAVGGRWRSLVEE